MGRPRGSGLPRPAADPGNLWLAVPRHFVVPSTQQWNLTVQRALGKQWVLEVGYVGTQRHAPARDARCAAVAGCHADESRGGRRRIRSPRTPSTTPSRVRAPRASTATAASSCSPTMRTRTTTRCRRRCRGAGEPVISRRPTPSRVRPTRPRPATPPSTPRSTTNRRWRTSRGLSDFDRTHRLAVSYRYDLPFFSSAEGLKHTVAGRMGRQRHHHHSVRARRSRCSIPAQARHSSARAPRRV